MHAERISRAVLQSAGFQVLQVGWRNIQHLEPDGEKGTAWLFAKNRAGLRLVGHEQNPRVRWGLPNGVARLARCQRGRELATARYIKPSLHDCVVVVRRLSGGWLRPATCWTRRNDS